MYVRAPGIDWSKILTAVGTAVVGGLCAWGVPAARRAVKNYGKTDVDIANEKLEEAIAAAKKAHENTDPSDDAAADAAVANAKRMREQSLRLKAIADALAEAPASE